MINDRPVLLGEKMPFEKDTFTPNRKRGLLLPLTLLTLDLSDFYTQQCTLLIKEILNILIISCCICLHFKNYL